VLFHLGNGEKTEELLSQKMYLVELVSFTGMLIVWFFMGLAAITITVKTVPKSFDLLMMLSEQVIELTGIV
jgi:hypothetical protein